MLTRELTFLQPTTIYRELILLEEIGRNSKITQSLLAQKAGIVPAMVNNYIKNFVRDGFVEVAGNKTRNMTYLLTPEGERKKFNLLLSYLKEAVSLYKNAKEGLQNRLVDFKKEDINTIILYGAAETAELTLSAAEEVGLEILEIVDSDKGKQGKDLFGKVIRAPHVIESFSPDAVVISSFGFQNQIYEEIKTLEKKGIKVRKL